MRCPQCGYHNLPGAATCGQCGRGAAASAAATAGHGGSGARVEDVYPPRARDRPFAQELSTRLRRPLQQSLGRAALGRAEAGASIRAWLIASASLLPGWGQWLEGRRRAALSLFGLALLIAVAAAALIRNPASNALLALFFLLQWYSVWDAARHCFPPALADDRARLLRLERLGLLSAALVLGTLAGASVILNRRYEFLRINTREYTPIFRQDDELVVRRLDHPLARLRRGDVVIGSPQGADPRVWEMWRYEEDDPQHAWIGPAIDRILGLPGDRIEGRGITLWVNGAPVPPERQPLAMTAVPPFTAVVPRGCVAVWRPGQAMWGAGPTSEEGPLSMLPASGINGQVVAIDQPAERRRWVR